MQTGLYFEAVKLIDDALRALFESLEVGIAPPVGQVSGGAELRSLIVKPVCHFVADDGTHGAIVERVVCLRVKERWLQDARGKNDFVDLRVVVCVHGWRRHEPLHPVNGLADFRQVAPLVELTHA